MKSDARLLMHLASVIEEEGGRPARLILHNEFAAREERLPKLQKSSRSLFFSRPNGPTRCSERRAITLGLILANPIFISQRGEIEREGRGRMRKKESRAFRITSRLHLHISRASLSACKARAATCAATCAEYINARVLRASYGDALLLYALLRSNVIIKLWKWNDKKLGSSPASSRPASFV